MPPSRRRAAIENPEARTAAAGGAGTASAPMPSELLGSSLRPFRWGYRSGLGATILAEFPMDLSDALIEIAGDWNDRDGSWPAEANFSRWRWIDCRGEDSGSLVHCELQRMWRAGEIELTGYRDSTSGAPEVGISRRAISRVVADDDAIEAAVFLDQLRLDEPREVFLNVRVHLTETGRAARWYVQRLALPDAKGLAYLTRDATSAEEVLAVLAGIDDVTGISVAAIAGVLAGIGVVVDEKQTFGPEGRPGGRPSKLPRAIARARRALGHDADSVLSWLRSFPDLEFTDDSIARSLR